MLSSAHLSTRDARTGAAPQPQPQPQPQPAALGSVRASAPRGAHQVQQPALQVRQRELSGRGGFEREANLRGVPRVRACSRWGGPTCTCQQHLCRHRKPLEATRQLRTR
jgi:hypothetical protein